MGLFHPVCWTRSGGTFSLGTDDVQVYIFLLSCCVDDCLYSLTVFSLSGTLVLMLDNRHWSFNLAIYLLFFISFSFCLFSGYFPSLSSDSFLSFFFISVIFSIPKSPLV